jgi:hypothetical protein
MKKPGESRALLLGLDGQSAACGIFHSSGHRHPLRALVHVAQRIAFMVGKVQLQMQQAQLVPRTDDAKY